MAKKIKRNRSLGRGIKHGKELPMQAYIIAIALLVVVIAGMIFLIRRYTPTREHMELTEYFELRQEDQAAVILNGSYMEVTDEDDAVYAIVKNDSIYFELNFLKDNVDDGYVYDSTEGILRYATDSELITANLNSPSYLVDRTRAELGQDIVISENGSYFLLADFVTLYTDMNYTVADAPARVTIETAGYEKTVTTLKRDAALRRFGGVKSKILKDASKGDEVSVLENYGKWSYVLTDDGVLACVQNRRLNKTETVTVANNLEKRTYNHMSSDEGIILGWHQVTSQAANSSVSEVLASSDLNVISPTWFTIADNQGDINSLASSDYVSYCHERGIQVWGLFSNIGDSSIDSTVVLNTTSSRDNLVNNLISQAISYNLDGINVDLESLSASAKDGYIQFIRELSIKCEKNDIVLSVDNYVPTASTAFYNRSVQADYADYVVVMAYDEHYSGSEEAGSVASISFVENGVKDTLEEVPAEQIILGMPFYARVWKQSSSGLTSSAYGMEDMDAFLERNGAAKTWSEECGQYYAEFTEGDTTYMAWTEDATSLGKKLDVMKDNKLAGAAFWKLGFETADIWKTIGSYF